MSDSPLVTALSARQKELKLSDVAFCRDVLRWERTTWLRMKRGDYGASVEFLSHLLHLDLRIDGLEALVMDEIKRRDGCHAAA